MVKLLKECSYNSIKIKSKTDEDVTHLFYFVVVSHFLVAMHAGQKFVSPARSGTTPR